MTYTVSSGTLNLTQLKLLAVHTETKKKCSWVQFITGRHPMRSFSPTADATIAPWNSAPMRWRFTLDECFIDTVFTRCCVLCLDCSM